MRTDDSGDRNRVSVRSKIVASEVSFGSTLVIATESGQLRELNK